MAYIQSDSSLSLAWSRSPLCLVQMENVFCVREGGGEGGRG